MVDCARAKVLVWWRRGSEEWGGEVATERPRRRALSSCLWILFGGDGDGGAVRQFFL